MKQMAFTGAVKLLSNKFYLKKFLFPTDTCFRSISTTDPVENKRKWISKWKNQWPDTVYTEVDLEERCFDKILGTMTKNRFHRRNMFKLLLDRLVTHERVVVTYIRGKGLARLAEHLIDTAKKGDEPGVYTLMHRKELIPRVFEDLLPRFQKIDKGYTRIYHLVNEANPRVRSGRELHHVSGNAVVEFVVNNLPPILPSDEELYRLTYEKMNKQKEAIDSLRRGTNL